MKPTLKKIIDINGDSQYKKDCVLYKKNYYHTSHPSIFYVIGLEKYMHESQIDRDININLMITEYNKSEQKFIFNYCLRDLTKNESIAFYSDKNICGLLKEEPIYLAIQAPYKFYNIELLLHNSDFIFSKNDQFFYYIGNIEDKSILDDIVSSLNNYTSAVATHRAYNIEDNPDYRRSIDLYNNSNIEIEKDIRMLKKYLKDYSFGVEIETSRGSVYPSSLSKYGFSVCRDGSIENDEYVSIPMKGIKGLQAIKKFINFNTNNVKTDYNCSLHVHVGNVRTDKVYINALYNFLYYFQQDYFNYFPFYKKENVLNKRKHYTKALPDLCQNISNTNKDKFATLLNYNYNNIFLFLTDGYRPDENYNKKSGRHPFNNKWDRLNRYFVFNFMNLIFSNRRTIEFRIHENTFNSNRVVKQILLSIAILEFVNKYTLQCLEGHSFSVLNVIDFYFKGDFKKEMIDYYNYRKRLFSSSNLETFEYYTSDHYGSI